MTECAVVGSVQRHEGEKPANKESHSHMREVRSLVTRHLISQTARAQAIGRYIFIIKPTHASTLTIRGQAVVQKIPSQSHRIAGQETSDQTLSHTQSCGDLDGRDANDKRIPFSQCTFFKMMQVLKSSLGFPYTSNTGTSMFLSQIGQHIFSIHDGDVPCNLI